MATINSTYPSLLDLVKSKDPSGAQAKVVEKLTQETPILEDIPFREGNMDTGHRISARTALPTIQWGVINKGYAASKGATGQVDEACGMMIGKSVIDRRLVELNGGNAYRLSQDLAFTQSFKHEFESGLIYHSTKTAPEKFMGFAPRLSATTDPAGNQILLHDAAAAGADQTSMYLIGWGSNSVYGIVPKGSSAGLKHADMGLHYEEDADGNKYAALVTEWSWNVGLCVEDWRYIVRVANIDTSNLATTGRELITSMMRAEEEKMKAMSGGITPVWYVNRKISSYLRMQAADSVKNSTMTWETIGGKRVLMFGESRVRRTDAILNTEAVVS